MAELEKATRHRLIRELVPANGDPVTVGPINALVGAADSGKTETLHDILRLAANFEPRGDDQRRPAGVLRDISLFGKLTVDRLTQGLAQTTTADGSTVVQGFGPDIGTGHRQTVGQDIKSILLRPLITSQAVRSTALGSFMPLRALYLDADSRTELIARSSSARPDRIPENLLQALHDAPRAVHEQLDAAFELAFPGMHLRLDDSDRVQLTLRVASEFPALTGDALTDMRANEHLAELDDACASWRSFAGIVLGVLLAPGRIVLIDQPELQLPAKTARCLGGWLARHTAATDCQLFLATNSTNLLTGLLESDVETTVVRCGRDAGVTRLEPVPHEASRKLACHPLLASQKAIDCLFADTLVVVPHPLDALACETIAAREKLSHWVRFVHTFGPHHLAQVTHLLRQTGIPLSVVMGVEVLQDEQRFCKLVEAGTGTAPPKPWLATRERVARYCDGSLDEASLAADAKELEEFLDQLDSGPESSDVSPEAATSEEPHVAAAWNLVDSDTLNRLPPELRNWVEDLLEELKQQRVFVSPIGGVAAWLRTGLSPGNQSTWLLDSIEAVNKGACPADLRIFVSELLEFEVR
jgi:hypothetical protein